MSRSFRFAAAAALGLASVGGASQDAAADVLNLAPVVDGTANDATGNGSFDSVNSTDVDISIRNFSTVVDRGLLEFSTSGIPNFATVNSVTFNLDEVGFTSSSSPVEIFGYAGDGSLSVADATAPGVLLGSYDPVAAGLGAESVALNVAAFETVRTGSPSSTIGLRFQTTAGTTNTQFASTEGGRIGFDAPVLVVNFTPVPEPTAAAAALFAGLGVLASRRRRGRA